MKRLIKKASKLHFNPRAPRGARRGLKGVRPYGRRISIHAPREGRDGEQQLSGRLCGISIHAPREGRDRRCRSKGDPRRRISIHAPREGRDLDEVVLMPRSFVISIHAPREGRDPNAFCKFSFCPIFQSTRPARGATKVCEDWANLLIFQSTRPARGATDAQDLRPRRARNFNPRAPRGARR